MKALWTWIQAFAFITAFALLSAPQLSAAQGQKASKEKKSKESKAWAEDESQGAVEPEGRQSRDEDSRAESIIIEPRHPPSPPHERFGVNIDTDRGSYYIGDSVRLYFSASDDAYVYIFNTDAQGITRQLFPNYYDSNSFVRAGRRYSIPGAGYSLVASGPAGRESVRIVGYRQRWRVLDQWHRFRSTEPFPQRSLGPDQMQSQIEREAQSGHGGKESGREEAPQSLRIVPVPRPSPPLDYAEDWAYFNTLPRYGQYPPSPPPYYPYPPVPAPPGYYPPDYGPVPYRTGAIRMTTSPTNCDVYINGAYSGRSPGTFTAPEGLCEIVVSHSGYETHRTEFRVRANVTQSLSVRLRRGWD